MARNVYITESQLRGIKRLLLENEGTNLKKARNFLRDKGYNESQRQEILNAIRTDIPNSRLQQCKFIMGVVRMYLNGELKGQREISDLNKTLKYIASDAHSNEYDYNLNGESLSTLVDRFRGVARNDLEKSMSASNSRRLAANASYTIVQIDSFEEAEKYGRYTDWCVTRHDNMYDSYTNDGTGRFYFCLRNGFENEPRTPGNGYPLDSYGLSMIAVSVDIEGAVNTITCRWNHNNGGNDNIMTVEQLEDVIGRNFYQTFRPYSREELHSRGVILFDEVQELLDSGKNPKEIFECVDGGFHDGFARVALNRKWNYLDTDKKRILSDQWFDGVGDFYKGFAQVRLNGKWNLISTEGKLLSNQWFDRVSHPEGGFAQVRLNNKYNIINTEGRLLSNQWFDFVGYAVNFAGGFAQVQLNGKWNLISREGRLLSNQWFDSVSLPEGGFARVRLNGICNFINTEGRLLSDQWFDEVSDFYKGFAQVRLNNKYNLINTEGRLLSNQWFDRVNHPKGGFARVQLNGKWNLISREGRLLSNQWFDYMDYNDDKSCFFGELNSQWYEINANGEIVDEYKQALEENKKMGKRIYITENQLGKILENTGIIDEHIAVIDNTKDVESLIKMQWTSPDDYWFIQVTQRKKDFRNYNNRHGGKSKWWRRVQGIDGTVRENFAGYGVVKGNTVQEAINCLRNIKIKLNPWAAQVIGQNEVQSNGGMEAIYDVCDKLWARAYITINKRSMSRSQRIASRGGLRAFEKESSRNHKDVNYYPWSMIDMDIDDPNAEAETDTVLKKLNINPSIKHGSHDGTHYFFNNRDIMKYDENKPEFAPIARKYAASKQPGEAFTMKEDAKMIIYSPCGQ